MKKSIIPFLLALLFIGANAQETGMHFEHNTTWQNILAKAKAENKYIFLDCFTTWCGPCKMMSAKIFPTAEVGDFYNAKYINVGAQMDTLADKDNEDVKSWYETSHEIAVKYEVNAYPTYLIFNSNGELVHRFLGSMEADKFIAKGHEVLMPEKQYYTQLHKYQAGEKSPLFLYQLAIMAKDAYDMKNAKAICDDYLVTQTDLYTKENLGLIKDFTNSSNDKGFAIMMKSPEKVDAVLGEGTSDNVVKDIILKEEIAPKIFSKTAVAAPDWISIEKEVAVKYPLQAKELTAYSKVLFYTIKKEWNNFAPAVSNYMKAYGSKASPMQVNNYAWTIFQNCNDMTCIKNALAWSKQSFAKNNNHQYIDTYANLLMKAGKKKEAIDWETKAVAIAKEKKDPQLGEYEETLSTMKGK